MLEEIPGEPAGAYTVVNPGEDLGYDIYAAEPDYCCLDVLLGYEMELQLKFDPAPGALVRERSAMASKGVYYAGGVIDAGYAAKL